jgi:site-specific DNA recombinase
LLQYAGVGVWNVRGKRQRFDPPSDWVIVENAHPAIVTLEEAEAIRQVREETPKMVPRESGAIARSTGSRYMLSGGLFTCGNCGANMVGFTSTNGKGRKGDYYVCGTAQYRKGLGCGKGVHIDKETIEQAVWQGVEERFKEWTDVEAFAQMVNDKIRELHTQYANTQIEAERRLAEIGKKIRNLRRALEDSLEDVKWADERLAELASEREKWEARLEAAGSQTVPPELDLAAIRRFYDEFQQVIAQGTNEEKREFIRCFVQESKLEPASREVTITFKGMPAKFVIGQGAGAVFHP